ncbi:MAG: cyclic nucleotide-binding domain-containing protein [Alphaproteobacteria bacterium]|jgi:CRP/FNR family transcriptional regulator, cyclic AMP receptor protein|nr:cyclic nucleotide-binding domain-containing protein [Alphaproteobacteria bacterium]MBT7744508.1 cyclic nucleotide-binding domain-containing protein [Alphaproteobacteria bacterium]
MEDSPGGEAEMRADDEWNFRDFEDGEVIFNVGDPGDEAYVIRTGSVDIVIEKDGNQDVVETLAQGDFLGEMALVDEEPRSASAIARGTVSCAVFSKEEIDRSLENSDLLTYALVKLLTKRLRKATAS